MKALAKRVARLEQAVLSAPRSVLVVIHGDSFDADSLTGIDGLEELRRLDGESTGDYIARLEEHLRGTQGRALPFVGIARYRDDDAPDTPSAAGVDTLPR